MKRLQQLAVSDQGFVFDPESGESFTSNAVGLEILAGLKQDKKPEAIALALTKKFNVEQPEAERDVADFVDRLRAFRLL